MPKVTLRAVAAHDQERLLAWRNSDAVAPYMYSDHLISEGEHAAWFARLGSNPAVRHWIIELDGAPVGLANLADIDLHNRRCAWAFYLADPAVRGLGVGSFVEYWVIEYVFGVLGLDKLWCEVIESNKAVWRLHEGFGFTREAVFRNHVVKGGEPLDVIGLGLLEREWRGAARQAARERLIARGFDLSNVPPTRSTRTTKLVDSVVKA